ncbi:ADR194Cp [Eremothecium gossypii ATCC 10895]|uniref:ADR194Cp n=1 Tax=Eremothecium gossypii (strain ATCC 10895 / CBS 109.51 / FGSC 9923 / NRRL Y-1056) TaxID=284811 RepID=Q759S9_EREGS|nr:ADR194Cp [Eremothecium gossypii ATCC 10895]AAS52114.2 ADR194Cp [Eremothecium gossypii ATCC 10895]AEY96413.1 FADR194Cp [Eremothecium gossypii FDAG1]
MGNTVSSTEGSKRRGDGRAGTPAASGASQWETDSTDRGRQQSITSQLFSGRHHARSKWKFQGAGDSATGSSGGIASMFKCDYTLNADARSISSEQGETCQGMPNLAGLVLDACTQGIRSPGPSTATVEHTNLEASMSPELASQTHRPSISALKQSLIQVQGQTNSRHRAEDIDTAQYVPSATIDIPCSNPSTNTASVTHRADDSSTRSSLLSLFTQDVEEYIEASEVVLNESLVDSVVRKDLRRKRQLQQQCGATRAAEQAAETAKQPDAKKKKLPCSAAALSATASGVVQSETEEQHSDAEAEFVEVIIKWRDCLLDPQRTKLSIVSPDIASVIHKNSKRKVAMVFSKDEQCWVAPDLRLPPGIYKLQFLINGALRHSNFLPTATDSHSNIVNWFEVVPWYDRAEPYRDPAPEEVAMPPESPQLTAPAAGRPPLLKRGTSSSSRARVVERSNTPISDYTGISRSGSARPLLAHHKSANSIELSPIPRCVLQYSTEIPELFKPEGCPPDPNTAPGSFNENIQDCNQDELFRFLQEDWKMSAQEAEEVLVEKYPVPDLPVYLNSSYLNEIFTKLQRSSVTGDVKRSSFTHIIPHVNLNHLLTSSIRDEIISVGCTTRYEGKFITQIMYAPCYYESSRK